MEVNLLFFGPLKDLTGVSQQRLDVAEPATLDTVWAAAENRYPRIGTMKRHVRPARNREFSSWENSVCAGDEIAFLPPVSGGSELFFAITHDPIETKQWVQRVQRPEDGAVVTFEGIVRNNTEGRPTDYLTYEGYEPMALEVMEKLGTEIRAAYAIGQIGIVHRLGRVPIGEASVVIAVSAPHRKAAFDACFEAINRLKTTVPIWKKEHFGDGEVWVEGAWIDAPPRR